MAKQLGGLLERQRQLNGISYVVILALIMSTGVFGYMLLTGLQLPDAWILRDHTFRTLVTGLLLAVILYLVDQHRRLRSQLIASHDELDQARREVVASFERLCFAHHAAEVMTSLAQEDGLQSVLAESCAHFGADVAGLVGDEVTLVKSDGIDAELARTATLKVAMETVRAGVPLTITGKDDGSTAVAVPLRIRGKLNAVVVLWKRAGEFTADDLEGLRLVARIVELGIDNRALLNEARTQISGMMKAMVELIERRRPEYTLRSTEVADHAVAVGEAMGLRGEELAELRLGATLRDVGMLEVSETISGASRLLTREEQAEVSRHARMGADLARVANLSPRVQDAILCHHERVDGSGYPRGLRGDEISLEARILAVCDSYVAMTSGGPHRQPMSHAAAIAELRASAGLYDAPVVREFARIVAGQDAVEAPDAGVLHGFVASEPEPDRVRLLA
jgi:HD-GYP domain-containing protein (c-di-GMP phosphodiesterase class II)